MSRVQPVESHSRVRSGWLVRRCSQFDRTGQLDALVVCVLFFFCLESIDFPAFLGQSMGTVGKRRPAMDPLSCSPSYRLARLRKCPDTQAMGANGFKDQEQRGKQHHTYNYKAEAVIIIATGNRGHNADAMLANAFQGTPWDSFPQRLGATLPQFALLSFSPLSSPLAPSFQISVMVCVFSVCLHLEGGRSGAAVRVLLHNNSEARSGRGRTMSLNTSSDLDAPRGRSQNRSTLPCRET